MSKTFRSLLRPIAVNFLFFRFPQYDTYFSFRYIRLNELESIPQYTYSACCDGYSYQVVQFDTNVRCWPVIYGACAVGKLLTCDLGDSSFIGCHMDNRCTKFENPRSITASVVALWRLRFDLFITNTLSRNAWMGDLKFTHIYIIAISNSDFSYSLYNFYMVVYTRANFHCWAIFLSGRFWNFCRFDLQPPISDIH